jgi:hypothetical protein
MVEEQGKKENSMNCKREEFAQRWEQRIPSKCTYQFTFNGKHGVIFQKIVTF